MTTAANSKVLLTGATGFLGRHLTEQLVARGNSSLRVLNFGAPPDWLVTLDLEIVDGSITDANTVRDLVQGADAIYHLAGQVSRDPDDARQMHVVHVEGTRVLCEAARDAGVRRIVMASSSGTVAVSKSKSDCPDESWPTPMAIISRWPYYVSKAYQEQVARRICGDDVELVIVNPSLLLGPGDDRLSSTQDVLRFLQRDIPAVPSGGVNFVDARDAAAAFIAAMERGRPGERYLLGGPNWTCREFFGRLERVSKVSAPKLQLPDKLALFGARVVDSVYRHAGRLPPLEFTSVEMGTYFWYLDDSKARRELGFSSRDPLETLYDTVTYLRDHFLGSDAFS